MTSFDPIEVLRVLKSHGVPFVIVGGVAARIWGSPTVTRDVDICAARDAENLERLAAALTELGATLRGVDDDVPFLLAARTLEAGGNFTFSTRRGPLDVLAYPAGVDGYDELVAHARPVMLGDLEVLVADLQDLITMKTAAGRPKDRVEVEILRAIADEVDDL